MQAWFDLFENFLAIERYDFCFIIRQRPVRSYGRDESFAGIRETVECFGMLHGTSMSRGSTSSAFGHRHLTTRHKRIGVQSMVNRMNRLLGCSLATGLQGKNEEANRTTHLVLSQQFSTHLAGFHQARWLIVVSD
jgi:hypothetical protein